MVYYEGKRRSYRSLDDFFFITSVRQSAVSNLADKNKSGRICLDWLKLFMQTNCIGQITRDMSNKHRTLNKYSLMYFNIWYLQCKTEKEKHLENLINM